MFDTILQQVNQPILTRKSLLTTNTSILLVQGTFESTFGEQGTFCLIFTEQESIDATGMASQIQMPLVCSFLIYK